VSTITNPIAGGKMRKLIYVLIMAAFLTYPVFAGGNSSLYVGGSLGSAFVETSSEDLQEEDLKIDKNNFAYKIFGGYRFTDFMSAEGGYRNLGQAENKVLGSTLSTKTYGWDVAAVGKLEIILVNVFAKAGMFFWNTKSALDEFSEEESGNDFFWGLGAGVNLGMLEARIEWEKFEVESPENLTMLSIGVTFGF
jgi:opacity protein-like surface antigen